MTDKYLKTLIDKLNKNKTDGLIHLRPLTEFVDFAKVWREKPKPTDDIVFPDGPDDFYFIKNQEKEYVATVMDMSSTNLHWFVVNRYRGKGYLTNALRKTILPHLLQNRKEQKITIDRNQIGDTNFKSSEKVALSIGFIQTKDAEYKLKTNDYKTKENNRGRNTEITEERINELKRQISYLSRSLWLIQSEIEMKIGDEKYAKELRLLIDKLKKHTWKLEDAWWKNKTK